MTTEQRLLKQHAQTVAAVALYFALSMLCGLAWKLAQGWHS